MQPYQEDNQKGPNLLYGCIVNGRFQSSIQNAPKEENCAGSAANLPILNAQGMLNLLRVVEKLKKNRSSCQMQKGD